jgi:ATP-dependent DNA helicase RecQ
MAARRSRTRKPPGGSTSEETPDDERADAPRDELAFEDDEPDPADGDDDEGFAPDPSLRALASIDRDVLLAELGVAPADEADDADEDDGEIVSEGDLDAPEAVREAALRLGIQRLHPEQKRVIAEVCAGRDVLMVLPTGFGKSACYQIPSMILPKPVLVISPLLALMRDQSQKLAALGVPCVRLDGTVRGKERAKAIARVAAGGSLLVLTTPESLFNEEVIGALGKSGISMAAVDEAHCISEWGYDFRPAYLQLGERIRTLGRAPILALTATATPKVRDAVQRFLGMEDAVIVSSSPHRSNLAFDVVRCGEGARLRAMLRLAFRVRRPGIIYCSTTREVDEIYAILQRFGIPSHRYHGKMNSSERTKNQDGFMRRGRRTVMVATNAFGLGIDKADIRYVMHYHAPGSLEQYVQEAGRAGRDGRRANCILLYAPEDRKIHEALLGRSRVRPEQLYKLGRALAAWAGEHKTPSLSALALSANLGTRTTGALLALLEEATLVRFDQTEVHVTVPADQIEEEARQLATQFETLRTQDARRLDAVSDYADETNCRASFLSGYFGEDPDFRCGLCDRCRGGAERPESFFEPLVPPRRVVRRREAQRGRGRRGRERGRGRGPHRGPARPYGPGPAVAFQPAPSGEAGSDPQRRRRRRGRRRGRRGGSHPQQPGALAGGSVPLGWEPPRFEPALASPPPEGGGAAPERFEGGNGGQPASYAGEGQPRRRRRRRGRRRGRGRGPRPPFEGSSPDSGAPPPDSPPSDPS